MRVEKRNEKEVRPIAATFCGKSQIQQRRRKMKYIEKMNKREENKYVCTKCRKKNKKDDGD